MVNTPFMSDDWLTLPSGPSGKQAHEVKYAFWELYLRTANMPSILLWRWNFEDEQRRGRQLGPWDHVEPGAWLTVLILGAAGIPAVVRPEDLMPLPPEKGASPAKPRAPGGVRLMEIAYSPASTVSMKMAEKFGEDAVQQLSGWSGHRLGTTQGNQEAREAREEADPDHLWISMRCGPLSPPNIDFDGVDLD